MKGLLEVNLLGMFGVTVVFTVEGPGVVGRAFPGRKGQDGLD